MIDIPIAISMTTLFILLLTFWITRLNKGKVKMTRPNNIGLSFPDRAGKLEASISIDTLLYSTAEKGKHIQTIFVCLQWGENSQNFNRWRYNEGEPVWGRGLFVNKTGVSATHEFLMPGDGSNYVFLSGDYVLQIFVECVDEKPRKIEEYQLALTAEQSKAIMEEHATVYFTFSPNSQKYVGSIMPLQK